MKILVGNIRTTLEEDYNEALRMALKKAGINQKNLIDWKVSKESIDARKKTNICVAFTILLNVQDGTKVFQSQDVRILEEDKDEPIIHGTKKLATRPIVVGTGPAGLFAGLLLAQWGFKPIVLERGLDVEGRTKKVEAFWNFGVLDTECNVQFGEGGAGTFSDGKLTTRNNDRRCEKVLTEFYNAGANKEILFQSKPHIGTDILKKVVENMRKTIIELGGEVRFQSKLTGLVHENGALKEAEVNSNEKIPCEVLVLAIGHSARDTFEMLHDCKVKMIQKPFSIGVRIEHPQELINKAQYGKAFNHPRLSAADYQLFCKLGDRTAYSFCMCPGGIVVASASEENTVVTNGMSEYARDRENANSALVVSVEPADFGGDHPLQGIEFQRKWEKLAFNVAGKSYAAPVQRLADFVKGERGSKLGSVKPSYTGAVEVCDINACLPEFVTSAIKESFGYFDRKLNGFAFEDAILTGVETRTSSPVRIPRGDTLEADGISGLYPTGEGAGFAGGIVSAAVDGLKVAELIIKTYKPC